MKGEILKLLYIYSLNKRIFDKTAIEILYNIFINNNYDIEKYFKKIIITNEDDIVALYSQEKNSIIKQNFDKDKAKEDIKKILE